MIANVAAIFYLSLAVAAVLVAGHVLRSNGRTLLVAACPEGNRSGAEAGMRLIMATFYLFGFGFVFLIASTGNAPADLLAALQVLVMKLGSGMVLLGLTSAGASLSIQGVVTRAATRASASA